MIVNLTLNFKSQLNYLNDGEGEQHNTTIRIIITTHKFKNYIWKSKPENSFKLISPHGFDLFLNTFVMLKAP